jgi:hypothetical protein
MGSSGGKMFFGKLIGVPSKTMATAPSVHTEHVHEHGHGQKHGHGHGHEHGHRHGGRLGH